MKELTRATILSGFGWHSRSTFTAVLCLRNDNVLEPLRLRPSGADFVLLTKAFINDTTLTQPHQVRTKLGHV